MLRGHRIALSSSPETLWSIGLRMGKGRVMTAAKPRPACLLQQCQPFSTGLVKEKHPSSSVNTVATHATTTTSKPPVVGTRGNVLGAAAEEAQRLSELAAQNRKDVSGSSSVVITSMPRPLTTTPPPPVKKRTIDEATMQSALEGAQKLLLVTTSSSPLQDAIQNKRTADPDIQKQISTLHRAFLAVTSWCLDVVDTMDHDVQKDPRMLDKALEVARRAHQLQLPFHLPLHQRLMASVAQYYDPELQFTAPTKQRATAKTLKNQLRSPGGMVLEIAERASVSLGPNAIPSSHFFRDSLVAFAERRRFRDVVVVLKGMESQFRIVELELDTLAHLLAVLTEKVEEDANSYGSIDGVIPAVDSADFLEILSMLNPYVWKTMSNYGTLSDMLVRQNMQQTEELDEENQDHTNPKENVIPTQPSIHSESSNRRKKFLDIHRKKDDLYYFRGWIYHNESPSEHDRLPDITAQIEELYDTPSFRYSQDLERSILNRCLADEDDSTLAMMDADDYLDEEDVDILSDVFPDEDSDDFDDDLSSDDDDDDDDTGV